MVDPLVCQINGSVFLLPVYIVLPFWFTQQPWLLHIFELHRSSDVTIQNKSAYISIVHFMRGAWLIIMIIIILSLGMYDFLSIFWMTDMMLVTRKMQLGLVLYYLKCYVYICFHVNCKHQSLIIGNGIWVIKFFWLVAYLKLIGTELVLLHFLIYL